MPDMHPIVLTCILSGVFSRRDADGDTVLLCLFIVLFIFLLLFSERVLVSGVIKGITVTSLKKEEGENKVNCTWCVNYHHGSVSFPFSSFFFFYVFFLEK